MHKRNICLLYYAKLIPTLFQSPLLEPSKVLTFPWAQSYPWPCTVPWNVYISQILMSGYVWEPDWPMITNCFVFGCSHMSGPPESPLHGSFNKTYITGVWSWRYVYVTYRIRSIKSWFELHTWNTPFSLMSSVPNILVCLYLFFDTRSITL